MCMFLCLFECHQFSKLSNIFPCFSFCPCSPSSIINNKIAKQSVQLYFNLISFMIALNKSEPTSPPRPSSPKSNPNPKQTTKDSDNGRFSTASSRRILEDQVSSSKQNKYTGCNCTKSQCLKMYCACFSVGKMCDQTCLCQSCKNENDNMDRSEAINQVITKDPHAFSRKHNAADFSECLCNCRKSFCQKKYCDCYRRGKQCGQACQCYGCNNKEAQSKGQQKLQRKPTKLCKLE